MRRTNDKRVIEELKAHVLENFTQENYGNDKDPITNLRDQIDSMRLDHESIYATAVHYVEGGGLLVYYADQRGFLMDLLESNKDYTDQQVWARYIDLCARTITNLYTEGK